MSFNYEFARPALCVDIVVFGFANNVPSLLVIQRALPPFQGGWALPGGYVRIDETLEDSARRELQEETAITKVHLEQLASFSALNRDPRERTITVAFFAMVQSTEFQLLATTDAMAAKWVPLHQKNLNLAFDHNQIVEFAKKWLRERIFSQHIALRILPEFFTLTQVQELYEGILDQKIDKRNFRKQILSSGLLKKTTKKLKHVAYRSPLLYSLSKKAFT